MTTDVDSMGNGGQCFPGLSALEVARNLGLEPHREGGYFRETYRSAVQVRTEAGERPLSTAILYLVTENEPSRFHRLRADELWFYHAGAPLELLRLGSGVSALSPEEDAAPQKAAWESQVIGPDLPQALLPALCWAAARVVVDDQADWGVGRAPERRWTRDRRYTHDHRWTLVSCVVSPGFVYDDFELADRESLLRDYPQARQAILALT